jgi:PAS domain S-box-containing protein
MQVTVRCPRCGKSLKAAREMIGRRVRCSKCLYEFELSEDVEASPALSTDELPTYGGAEQARDNTLSRSMLPVKPMPAVPADEMLARLEPGSLRWLNATEAVEEFLGETIEALRKRSFTEFLHPDDRALAEDEFRKAIELGERHDFVLRLPDSAGRMRYVRVYSQARYNPDGTINHVRCYLKDATERVQAEQELRRRTEQLTAANEQLRQNAQKLREAQSQLVHTEKLASLGTLAAGMAHEINNPLAFAMNNVSVLAREVGDLLRLVSLYQEGCDDLRCARPELAERIDALQAEADLPYLREHLPRMTQATREGLQRVAKIVENLRGFAQLDRSEVALIDVNTALDHSLGMLADALAQNQVKVQKQFEPLPELECAAAPLNQVFLNLFMNALQAIESTGRGSGRLRVSTNATDGEIVVEVADDGCGIPADVVPRIFDPFFTTKPVGRGTGLGLSISHGIVAEHGGRIEVESALGVGSRFRIHLPTDRSPHRTTG